MAELFSKSLFSDANLVAYYRFNSGGLLIDSKGSYTLTNHNSVAHSSGKYEQCADFSPSNTNKRLHVGNNMGITNGPISLTGWIRVYNQIPSSSEWAFFSHGDSGTKVVYYVSYMDYSGREVRFRRFKGGVGVQDVSFSVDLNDGLWHFFVLAYDGTTLRGYFDGSLVGSTSASGNGTSGYTNSFHTIGCTVGTGDSPTFHFSGLIDDHGVFSRSLSSSEVEQLYRDSLGGSFFYAFL